MFILGFHFAHAQKIESIHVHLYTDSLKKNTFNYINIDGLLSTGKYMPLDNTHLSFSASSGRFEGNSLWIDSSFKEDKVDIKVALLKDPSVFKEFTIYIKKNPDPPLKTIDEIMNISKKKPKRGKK